MTPAGIYVLCAAAALHHYYDEQPRNPYRAAHAAAHSAAQGVPAPQCGPDAARGSRGIVSVAHYGGMDA